MNRETTWCPDCGELREITGVVESRERTFGREVRAEIACEHQRITFIGSNAWGADRQKEKEKT